MGAGICLKGKKERLNETHAHGATNICMGAGLQGDTLHLILTLYLHAPIQTAASQIFDEDTSLASAPANPRSRSAAMLPMRKE
jgi:hypothetical protein